MFRRAFIIAAALAPFSSEAPAYAADPSNEFLANLVGPLYRRGESFACFSRQYDAAHLTAHPRQQVTFVKALVTARFQASTLTPASSSYAYQVSLAFKFHDRAETLTAVAECGDGTPKDSRRGGAHCAGPGDGGSHLALDGRQAVVLTIPGGADLWMPGPIDKRHETIKNPFGPDDGVFRLVRTELKECEDLAFDRQKPLRPHEP
ncbi:hypothetical protein OGR47_08935 [Methylocystis sp. MJC1]|jgi:hypothetical protein|uniref:hypothetical protein n=1 Tax=Methylocystis sp. MJC1 TaxID=2654282 RepID=UPI0013EE04B5|nr:hypothetical protein [Methylocystis sp. MJC1]KAF2991651.1 hypothetical protein MJC1_01216 [Methylocystis sp. MJC1]MBU6527110.1 hypothetical protein [Methylocystis sp. MJC1]UZX13546.1 hypothetical protein OGR47_08935 [Methylocystis sp. MJC1]